MPDSFQIENPPNTENPSLRRYLRSQMQRISQAILDIDITGGGVPEAPIDGEQYGRQDADWTVIAAGGGVPEAPIDGQQYGRQDADWSVILPPGGAIWGDITGDIGDQSDLQNEFVNVTGDTMTGELKVNRSVARVQIGSDASSANIELGGGEPYIDFKTTPSTNFDWRVQEIDQQEFRIQAFNAGGVVSMYNVQYLDVGLSTINTERQLRLINSQGGVTINNASGSMRIGQSTTAGVWEESWITADRNAGTALYFNGLLRMSTDSGGINVSGIINATGNRVINVATPNLGTDAANKDYVDSGGGGGYVDGDTIKAALGSAGSPGLTFDGDDSTGFYSQVGIINAVTGGALRLNITALGLGMSGQIAMNNNSLNNPSNPTNANGVGDRGYNDARYLLLSGGVMTGFINMGNGANRINNSPEPVNNLDVANKIYVNNAVSDPRLKTNKHLVSEASILDIDVWEFEYIETDLINTSAPRFRPGKHFGIMSNDAAAISPDLTYPMPSDMSDDGISVSGENYQAVDDLAVLYLLLAEVSKLRTRIEALEVA